MNTKQSYPTIKDFVLQQAFERSFQTHVLGLKDYELQKSKIVAEKKTLLDLQFEKKIKEKQAARRIHKSSLINLSRMQKMQARHNKLTNVVDSTELYLAKNLINDQPKYQKLLKGLIIQGLIKMLQPIVFIRCLKRDTQLIRTLIPQCKKQFNQLITKAGIEKSVGQVDLKVDQRYFLEERVVNNNSSSQRVTKSQQNNKCFGGIILTNEDGLIVCKNTLDTRIELAYQHMLPVIRKELF